MKAFHNLKLNTIDSAHHNTFYKGVRYRKSPFDYVMYQMIMSEIRPDLVIEIGTNYGGGALYIADLMQLLNIDGEVHTIDIMDMINSDLIIKNNKIKRFLNGYQGYDTNLIQNFKNVMIIDDGSHMHEDVISAFQKFNKFVSKNSYYIIEDGIIDELNLKSQYNGGPLRSIQEIIENNNNYIIDRKWCDFYGENITYNPHGYLKCIA